MNIFHYILLTLSILGIIPSVKEAFKEKNKIGTIVVILVSVLWCTLIVLSAIY